MCNLRVSPSSERLNNQMWMHRFDGICFGYAFRICVAIGWLWAQYTVSAAFVVDGMIRMAPDGFAGVSRLVAANMYWLEDLNIDN